MPPERRCALVEALLASALVTGAVTVASSRMPATYIATGVGFAFLAATWWLVWRRDDATVVRSGLQFGGLVLHEKIDAAAVARSTGRSLAWALAFVVVAFVPFYFGWRFWWHAHGTFALTPRLSDVGSEVLGQVVIIALPEEAFYRGYLQSRLDDVWPPTWRVGGALVGPGLFVAAVIFALGHLATIHAPARLAVFFPALLFGWLRARTGGVGASIAFHASCNLLSEALGRGYGMY